MATGIFCTVAEVQRKVGVNASAISNTETYIDQFTAEAESLINAVCCENFSDNYTTLNVDVKAILKLAASNWAAILVLNYDPTGMPAREWETRIDVLTMGYNKAIQQLKEKSVIGFMNNA